MTVPSYLSTNTFICRIVKLSHISAHFAGTKGERPRWLRSGGMQGFSFKLAPSVTW